MNKGSITTRLDNNQGKITNTRSKVIIILSWLGYYFSKTILQNTVKKPCMIMINNNLRPTPINIWLVEDIRFCRRSGLPRPKFQVGSSFRCGDTGHFQRECPNMVGPSGARVDNCLRA